MRTDGIQRVVLSRHDDRRCDAWPAVKAAGAFFSTGYSAGNL
jgi:hypothetical protein